jgi:sialate O-acetylesterase
MKKILLGILSVVVWACADAMAEVKPHALFSDNMVLQQGQPVPVWGTATDGEKVTVKFARQTVTTTAKDGQWMVKLKPMPANASPQTMTITGANTVEVKNVLVGEVWIASGQSNMQWPLRQTEDAAAAIAAADNSQLRLFTVPRVIAGVPQRDVNAQWQLCTPATVPEFSAVAYYFGRDLRQTRKVPVGLIHASWGGTPAEAWTPRETLLANPTLAPLLEAKPRNPQNAATVLYNAMIAPLHPFAMQGVIWYQGESNSGRAKEYQTLFPAMIQSWRESWQREFPFLFVQIAPHKGMTPEIREAQLLTWQKTPKTAMVVITDHGDANDIHPQAKAPVGERLALAARAIAYGEGIAYSGPVVRQVQIVGGKAILSFNHLGGGLVAKDGDLKGFTVAGPDKAFVPATATIRGDRIVVGSDEVSRVVAVRFGWANVPDVNLFNKAGLPATPFRTDVEGDK